MTKKFVHIYYMGKKPLMPLYITLCTLSAEFSLKLLIITANSAIIE